MIETEKTIEWLDHLPCTDRSYPDRAIAALRAVKKLRDMVGECRGGGCTLIAVRSVEELLP